MALTSPLGLGRVIVRYFLSGAIVIFQGPGRPEEKVIVWVVFLDKLVTLVHGQPGMLDPGVIPIGLGGASLAAWVTVIFFVR